MKTHVRGFFDIDLHEVNWPSEDQCQEAIQNCFLFLSHT